MSYSVGSLRLSKWQLALIFGTPLAIGLGLYVYNKVTNSDPLSEAEAKARKKKSQKSADKDVKRQASKKSVDVEKEKMTPLKEANRYKNEGNICYRNGKFDEAISLYDKAIEKCPNEEYKDMAIFYQNRAASYEMLNKWNKVKEDCSIALDFNPRYIKAYSRRARAFEAMENMLECLNDVTAQCILEMFQNNSTIMFADRVLKQTGRTDAELGMKIRIPVLPSQSFVHTYLRSFVSDPLQTMTLPPSAIADTPPRGFLRAKQALDHQQYDDVIAACTEEIESSESDAQYKSEALLLRGTFHMLCGSFTDALTDLNAVIDNVAADETLRAYALMKRASLNIQMDEKDKGLSDFEAAQKLQPNNADIYHQRAQIYILLEQIEDALEQFEKVVKIAPHHAMAYVQKCYADYRLALQAQDHPRLAIVMNDFQSAIERFPDCVECYSLMAQVLSDQQQYAQADQFYTKAIKLAPNNASLLVHRGILVLQWHGDIEQAVQYMERALDVDPKCELAYETLGTVEVQRANLDRAVKLFESAIKYAKSQSEMCHLYALRNAAIAQINVTKKLGIDMSTISAMAQSGGMPINI